MVHAVQFGVEQAECYPPVEGQVTGIEGYSNVRTETVVGAMSEVFIIALTREISIAEALGV